MITHRSAFAFALAASLCCSGVHAGDMVVDAAQIASQAVGSKGANCPSFQTGLDGGSGKFLWTVEASPETSFDFAKIEIPVETTVSPDTIVILDADVDLADQSYLEIGLQLEDGRYFFSNVKDSEATAGRSYEFPLAKMASSDGKPFTDASARLAGAVLMVNSDASANSGASKVLIKSIVISP